MGASCGGRNTDWSQIWRKHRLQIRQSLTLRGNPTRVFNLQLQLLDRSVEGNLSEGESFSSHQLDSDVHALPCAPSSVHSCHGPIQPFEMVNCNKIYNFYPLYVRYALYTLQIYYSRVRTGRNLKFSFSSLEVNSSDFSCRSIKITIIKEDVRRILEYAEKLLEYVINRSIVRYVEHLIEPAAIEI